MLKLKYGLNLHSALEGKLNKQSPVFVLLLLFMISVTIQPSKGMAYIYIYICMYTDVTIL